jgi:2-oxoglutarate ferredoxin oxidoreductase subunit beta
MSINAIFAEFKSDKKPTWCPGCGDFGTMNGILKALSNTGARPETTFFVAGIGCSGKIGTYVRAYSIHGVHGRALPVGCGAKIANPDLEVVVAGGDGDGFSIGAAHFIHAVRRNVNMTYVVMDNRIYGLTKGQYSPTSGTTLKTKTSPTGTHMPPLNPLSLAFSSQGTFIAQSFSSDLKRHTEIVEAAIKHDGFGFVNVFSPCVTYNKVDTYQYFRDNLVDVKDIGHDPTDYDAAKELIFDTETEYQGILYQNPESISYEKSHKLHSPMWDIPTHPSPKAMDLLREFY